MADSTRSTPGVLAVELRDFLSFKNARIAIGHFTALVAPNASCTSNALSAPKPLRDMPTHGLPTAIARRGGFDQLRHRSHGHPRAPSTLIEFKTDSELPLSPYELQP